MRFLRLFITFLLSALVLIGGGYLLLREGVLWWATRQLNNDVAFLMRTNQWQNLQTQCYQEGGLSGARQLQLRFLDNKEYALELGCENFKNIPIEKKQLPLTVRKTTGTAGFTYDLKSKMVSGALTLQFLDQSRVLEAEEDELRTYWGQTEVVSDSLITSCQAHGFQCCDAVLEQGQGEVFRTGVNDCQEQCYASCLKRPNLVLFQTDPLLDPVARTVEVSKSVPSVFFRYTFGQGSQPLQQVKITYGDGTEETSTELSGEFVKQYFCQEESCTYRAQIQAVDLAGIRSSVTRIAEVDVVLVDR